MPVPESHSPSSDRPGGHPCHPCLLLRHTLKAHFASGSPLSPLSHPAKELGRSSTKKDEGAEARRPRLDKENRRTWARVSRLQDLAPILVACPGASSEYPHHAIRSVRVNPDATRIATENGARSSRPPP